MAILVYDPVQIGFYVLVTWNLFLSMGLFFHWLEHHWLLSSNIKRLQKEARELRDQVEELEKKKQ